MSRGKRVALVTGAASGIGLEIARRLVMDGAEVVGLDRDGVQLDVVAARLGSRFSASLGDAAVEADVARAVGLPSRLDALVCCAGYGTLAAIDELTVDQWDDVLAVCVRGPFLAIKHAARRLKAGGVIVVVSSVAGRQPTAGMASYCVAKAGLEMLVRVAAMELGARGIRVVAIAPGLIETPLTASQHNVPGLRDEYLEKIPLQRIGTSADVADAAMFLLSDGASWITGSTLVVDGGMAQHESPRLLERVQAIRS